MSLAGFNPQSQQEAATDDALDREETGLIPFRYKGVHLSLTLFTHYSGPLTYELNLFPRAGRNSSWS
jgi:hypothetical protein